MQDQNIKSFEAAKTQSKTVFFDRGMPDLIHYAHRFNVDPMEFEVSSNKYLYNKRVFLFSPWREIFINDSARKMTFEKSIEFHELLRKTYQELDYELVEVPFGTIEVRVDFILKEINDAAINRSGQTALKKVR